MSRLTIEHLAPYLPYGLHIKHNEGARLIICGAFKKYNADDFFTYSLLNWEKDVKSTDAKPILRPLSELHNTSLKWQELAYNHANCNNDEYLITRGLNKVGISFSLAQFLFQNHFDVFGLIEQGLAIDINTLKSH